MILKVKNLGKIQEAEIDLNKKFVLFTGYNNTGKTYLNYLLYGFYRLPYNRIKKEFDALVELEDLSNEIIRIRVDLLILFTEKLDELATMFKKILLGYCSEIFADAYIQPTLEILFTDYDKKLFIKAKEITENKSFTIHSQYLNTPGGNWKTHFKDGKMELQYYNSIASEDEFEQIKRNVIDMVRLNTYAQFERLLDQTTRINHSIGGNVYFFPAERAAFNEYAFDIILSKAEKYENNGGFVAEENPAYGTPDYPKPVNDYIKLVYNFRKQVKRKSAYATYALELEQLLKGKITVDPYGAIKYQAPGERQLDLHVTSSIIKSLAGLVLYLKYMAKEGDVLFIDEPELNLHPENQRLFTRMLVRLANASLKVFVSTHSDYIAKELSSLVLLEKEIPEQKELLEEFGLQPNDLLNKNEVAGYAFVQNGEVQHIQPNDYGIEIKSFDETIRQQGSMYEKVYFYTSEDE